VMRVHARCLPPLLGLAFALSACAGGGDIPQETADQNARTQARMAPDLAAGRASVQPLATAAQVTIADQALFAPGGVALSDQGREVLTRLVQSLLEPKVLHVVVVDSPSSPATLRGPRADAVAQFFQDHGLGGMIDLTATAAPAPVPAPAPVAAASAPPVMVNGKPVAVVADGMTVTVDVVASADDLPETDYKLYPPPEPGF
jgi:hypothetical protein